MSQFNSQLQQQVRAEHTVLRKLAHDFIAAGEFTEYDLFSLLVKVSCETEKNAIARAYRNLLAAGDRRKISGLP